MGGGRGATWFFTVRTTLMDRMLMEEIAAGADMVINLAAGLDCRPYRMQLPPGLIWVEVDTSELIDEKEAVLVMRGRTAAWSGIGAIWRSRRRGMNCSRSWGLERSGR